MTALFLNTVLLWIASVMLHEYAHARVAFAGGDHSVAAKGYLSMNPLKYLHPVTSLVLPAVILAIGGIPLPGGAVYIDHSLLRNKHWESAVSAAGPLANLVLLLVAASPFYLGIYDPASMETGTIWLTLALFCFFQIFCVIINLLPIPPLDGFGIIEPYLSYEARQKAREFGNLGFFLLLAIFFIPNPVGESIQRLAFSSVEFLHIPFPLLGEAWNRFMGFFHP